MYSNDNDLLKIIVCMDINKGFQCIQVTDRKMKRIRKFKDCIIKIILKRGMCDNFQK